MIEWSNLTDKEDVFYSSEVSVPITEEGVNYLIQEVVDLYNQQICTDTLIPVGVLKVEIAMDTGRFIFGFSKENEEGSPRAGCAIRSQSLQDIWYDVEEAVSEEAFDEAIESEIDKVRKLLVQVITKHKQSFTTDEQLTLELYEIESGVVVVKC